MRRVLKQLAVGSLVTDTLPVTNAQTYAWLTLVAVSFAVGLAWGRSIAFGDQREQPRRRKERGRPPAKRKRLADDHSATHSRPFVPAASHEEDHRSAADADQSPPRLFASLGELG